MSQGNMLDSDGQSDDFLVIQNCQSLQRVQQGDVPKNQYHSKPNGIIHQKNIPGKRNLIHHLVSPELD